MTFGERLRDAARCEACRRYRRGIVVCIILLGVLWLAEAWWR